MKKEIFEKTHEKNNAKEVETQSESQATLQINSSSTADVNNDTNSCIEDNSLITLKKIAQLLGMDASNLKLSGSLSNLQVILYKKPARKEKQL